jgi:hypothetical protein
VVRKRVFSLNFRFLIKWELMRKQIFSRIDSVLPRRAALLPYQVALLLLKLIFKVGLRIDVWNRNSTRCGSFIFGVSDLDLTLVHDGNCSPDFIRHILSVFKSMFPFLGETNIFERHHLQYILSKMNSFELMRDPELSHHFSGQKMFSSAEKFVFIVRMLFSDADSLRNDPKLRQRKWLAHFKLIGLEIKGQSIDFEFVLKTLKELSLHSPRIENSLQKWSQLRLENGFDIYQAHLGEGFGIMAPHCRLWFHTNEDTSYLKNLSPIEKEILLAQIDWEICGIYSQKFYLPVKQNKEHLGGLLRVRKIVQSLEDDQELDLVIFRDFFTEFIEL